MIQETVSPEADTDVQSTWGYKPFRFPVWNQEVSINVTLSDIMGATAKWIVRQSPYVCPDNLPQVLADVYEKFKHSIDWGVRIEESGFYHKEMSSEELKTAIENVLCPYNPSSQIPSLMSLNEPKKQRQPSAGTLGEGEKYDPDTDFIDLHALARNVYHTVLKEDEYEKLSGRDTITWEP